MALWKAPNSNLLSNWYYVWKVYFLKPQIQGAVAEWLQVTRDHDVNAAIMRVSICPRASLSSLQISAVSLWSEEWIVA